jgi:spermidine/putrescine transport system permease protein
MATPLFVVLLLVEISDLIFAVDSIPAIFAITKDPFIVYTSNVFAILGLRSLYFALEGIINKFLRNIGLIDKPIEMLYTPAAVIVGMTYLYLPLMILPIYAALEKVDKNLTEAAFDLGSSAWKSLRTISIPLAMPGILIGFIFVFVPSLGNFVVPELLGGGKTVMIGNLVRDQFLKARDWPFGATFALILAVILVILISIQSYVSKKVTADA